MERGLGARQKPEKVERRPPHFAALEALGVEIGTHGTVGRIDVVAGGSRVQFLVLYDAQAKRIGIEPSFFFDRE
jgi:hypothetical protein